MKRYLWILLIFLGGCSSLFSSHEGTHIQEPTLAIMSYNIHTGKGMDGYSSLQRIVEEINSTGADIVGLQELDRNTKRNPLDQPSKLEKLSGFNVVFSKNLEYQGGAYGIAIMSRFPIYETRILHYTEIPERETRGALAVKIQPESPRLRAPIWFVTTHLGTDKTGEEQAQQVKELLAWLESFDQNACFIVTGDFNQVPDSLAIRLMSENYVDLWNMGGENSGYTFNAVQPTKRIDYLFIRKGDFKSCTNAFVPHTRGSDHRPVVARVLW